jgi:hypothetical protein
MSSSKRNSPIPTFKGCVFIPGGTLERNKGGSGPILPAPGALPARTTTKVVQKKWGSEQKANVQKFQLRVSCLGLKTYNLATEILL